MPKKLYVPTASVDKCSVCGKKGSLRLCSRCANRAYCSEECQSADWKEHKPECIRAHRIDLSTLYPTLAGMACVAHSHQAMGEHVALTHVIKNAGPNPGTQTSRLPDGSRAKIVELGKPFNHAVLAANMDWSPWWPAGESKGVRGKLLRRISYEGCQLPIHLAISFSILAEIYTTSGPTAVRLRYRSSPISDFGIVRGRVLVTDEDRLAYKLPDGTIQRGQDPDDHYWLYFTTARGEDVIVDFGMFTFNMCLCAQVAPFLPPRLQGMIDMAPAVFYDRPFRTASSLRNAPSLHTEDARFSVLRNQSLQEVATRTEDVISPADDRILVQFMERVSGHPVTQKEKTILYLLANSYLDDIQTIVDEKAYNTWPKEVQIGIERDPGELDDPHYNRDFDVD